MGWDIYIKDPKTVGFKVFAYSCWCVYLFSRLKLLQETNIVFREETQVFYLILEVGDALNTHTQCISAVYFAVDATRIQYIWVDHTATQNLYPTGVFTETTAFATTEVTRDIHLGAGLGEGEVWGAQAYLGFVTEQVQ